MTMEGTPTSSDVLKGDPEALRAVRKWIRGAFTRYGKRLREDLDDLEGEILLALVTNLQGGRYREEGTLKAYVRSLVHYKCIDRIRGASRRQWVDVDDVELESESPSAFERVQRQQDVVIAREIMDQLPDQCRRMWWMIASGLSYQEMARRLGVSAGTLRVRVLRCRRRAEGLLARREEDS